MGQTKYRRVENPDWLDAAKRLPIGSRMRVRCCGRTKTAIISRNDRGYFHTCFSRNCDRKEYCEPGLRSIDQVQASSAAKQIEEQGWRLPQDFVLTIPSDAGVTAFRCGLSKKVLKQAGIGWSPSLKRIVVTRSLNWFETNWTARATLPSQRPKWLSSPSLTPWLMTYGGASTAQQSICIVEDAFSAVRLSKFIPTLPVLGTSITSTLLAQIPSAKTVIVWMDGDQAGGTAAKHLRSYLELTSRACYIITTTKDPKFYSDDEIRELLGKAHGQN